MAKVTFETDLCKGCKLCVDACPKGLIQIDLGSINSKGHRPAYLSDPQSCIGCGSCAVMCPDCVITVER